MGSLKLGVSVDNCSYYGSNDADKLCINLKSLRFNGIFLFSGCVNWTVASSSCKLGKNKASKFDTEFLDADEYNPVDCSFNNPKNSDREYDFKVESSVFNRDFEKVRVNTWKRTLPGIKRNSSSCKYKGKPAIFHDRDIDAISVVGFENVERGLSPRRCNLMLKEFEKSNDDKALRFFEWMRLNGKLKNNVFAYNLILRVLGRKADWGRAEAMIMEMVKHSACELHYQVFNTLIYACSKRGLVGLSSRWFRMMLDYKVEPNIATFGMLMSLYQRNRFIEEAEFTFYQMRSLKLQCQSAYSAMITIYTRSGLYNKAEDVIGFLKEDELSLNLENWLVMLNAYCQQGKLSNAEQVLSSMREAGFPPNIIAYNTMITGYGKVSRMNEAELMFEKLINVGLEPDETTYRSLIEGWGRAGDYNRVKLCYKELQMLGFKPNSSNLHTLMNLQARDEDDEGVIGTIEDMIKFGCQKSSILGIVLRAYEKAGRKDNMPIILESPLYDHVLENQTSCATVLTAFVKDCFIDSAMEVLRDKRWEDPKFEDHLRHLLICLSKDRGHLENAIKIFTSRPYSDKPNLNIFCTMIDIYSTMNNFSEAEKLYEELKESGTPFDVIAFSIIIRMYLKSGSLKNACLVIDKMEEHKDIVPDVYLLRDMLRIYQRCAMNDKLSALYYKEIKNGKIWDEEMYNCVINCCANALPVDELSRLFDEMLKQGFTPSTITFNVILNAYGKSRLFEKARKVFWLAKKKGLIDVISYNTLIAVYGKNKFLKNMSASVRNMQFDGFSVSLEAYNCMLDVYGKQGEMEKVRNLLHRMKDANQSFDHFTYNILINIYGERGWINEVTGVVMELKERGIGPDLCSYNTLIKVYGIAGMVEEAVILVKEMRSNGIEPDRITYKNLISALRKNDMVLEAVKWSLWMKQMGISGIL